MNKNVEICPENTNVMNQKYSVQGCPHKATLRVNVATNESVFIVCLLM